MLGAFFASLLSPYIAVYADSDCRAAASTHNRLAARHVAKVYDGDTVRLTNGDTVRLIGINAAEMGRDGKPNQPFAAAAKDRLQRLIATAGGKIAMLPGKRRRDRYDRLLAHIFLPDGSNISAAMLRRGLGWHIVVTPDTDFLRCYARAQAQARAARRGVWRKPNILAAKQLHTQATGFQIVRGKVSRISKDHRYVWLHFGATFAVRIEHKDLQYFPATTIKDLLYRTVEVSGWLFYNRRGNRRGLQMQVYHPAVIRPLDAAAR